MNNPSEYYKSCTLCPRACGVDRTSARGACGVGADVYAARAALHMWEEPCISGERGSGAVFFVGCSLGCVFCQNRAISRGGCGKPLTSDELADVFLRLENVSHANNVNLVTPTHFAPTVAEAIEKAKSRGLDIPVVWNSSGYESVDTLRLLDGLVDVYLPDLKYFSPAISAEYSHAVDYFERASAALDEMFRQVGEPLFSDGTGAVEAGIMTRGMIVRHLVLPTHTVDSCRVIRYIHDRFGDDVYISIMNQYTPASSNLPPELSRPLTEEEYDSVIGFAESIGVQYGFLQEGGTVDESFIPEFDGEGL